MRGMKILLKLAIFAAMAGLAADPAAAAPDAQTQFDTVIADLASEDPAIRQQAQQQLREAGRKARTALLKAVQSPDPAIALTARELLLGIPWHEPEDHPAVREALRDYGSKDPEQRRAVVHNLADDLGKSAAPALLRLLQEDPSDTVRWQVVMAIQDKPDLIDPKALRSLPDAANAPLLAARGLATWREDQAAALDLYRRVIELESDQPTRDNGAILPILNTLIGHDTLSRQFDEVARLHRIAIFRAAATDEASPALILRLFALHVAHGPLPGLHEDLQTHLPHLEPNLQMHVMAELCRATGNWLLALPARQLALRGSDDQQMSAGDLLISCGWQDAAERQFRQLLRDPDASPGRRIDTHLRLAYLRGQISDDAAAAAHLAVAMHMLEQIEGFVVLNRARGDDSGMIYLREQLYWRRLCDARDRGDRAAVEAQVELLMRTRPTDADILADLVPALHDLGRAAEADALAQEAYRDQKPYLDAAPDDAQVLNNIAWLMARTNQRLDEALKYAQWATTQQPYNAAFLDTLAEIHYMRGNPAESVELEKKALLLRPGDRFMTLQLEKYQAAAQGAAPAANGNGAGSAVQPLP